MSSLACNQTKVGEVYGCKVCGWEFEVTKECTCECTQDIMCCGKPLTKKSADADD